jgi:hypothetical protein
MPQSEGGARLSAWALTGVVHHACGSCNQWSMQREHSAAQHAARATHHFHLLTFARREPATQSPPSLHRNSDDTAALRGQDQVSCFARSLRSGLCGRNSVPLARRCSRGASAQMRTFSDPSIPTVDLTWPTSELAKMWWGVLTAVLASACATDLAHVASSQQAGHVGLNARGSTSGRVPATREGGDTVHHDEQQTRVDLSARRTHASRVHPMSVALPAAVGMPRAPRTSASLKWSTATLPP